MVLNEDDDDVKHDLDVDQKNKASYLWREKYTIYSPKYILLNFTAPVMSFFCLFVTGSGENVCGNQAQDLTLVFQCKACTNYRKNYRKQSYSPKI